MVARRTLADYHPELIPYFDITREPAVDPSGLYVTTPGQFPWTCDRGHETLQTVRSRIGGCKSCSGKSFLGEHYPDLVEEFDDRLNDGINPRNLYSRSPGTFFWKCKSGLHSWPASVRARIRGSSCIYCAGLAVLPGFNDATTRIDSSEFIWLLEENVDSSGSPIDPSYIPAWDSKPRVWWCVAGGHRKEISPAALMNAKKKGRGCRECLGLSNIVGRTDALTILAEAVHLLDTEFHHPSELSKITGGSEQVFHWRCEINPSHRWKRSARGMRSTKECPDCQGLRLVPGENDLASARPDIAAEWDYHANSLDPDVAIAGPEQVTQSSGRKVHWICSRGHKWMATPNGRTGQNLGCAFCSDRRCWPGFNDLATKRPDLLVEIDWDKENELAPESLLWVSHRVVSWACLKNPSHRWEAPVWYRTKGRDGNPQSCPNCNTTGFSPSVPYILYYLRHQGLLAGKIGITKEGSTRLAAFESYGWEVFYIWRFETGKDAMRVEQAFHRWRRESLEIPNYLGPSDMPRRLGGHEETFSDEAIGPAQVKKFIDDSIESNELRAR